MAIVSDKEFLIAKVNRSLDWMPEENLTPVRELYIQQREDVIKIAKENGLRDKAVLDVGTGRGRFALGFAKEGANVTAIDISEKVLEIARKNTAEKNLQVKFEYGDAENLQFADGSFDIVCCMVVLGIVFNPKKVISELERVCKAGGLVIVSVHNKNIWWRFRYYNPVKAVLYISIPSLFRYTPPMVWKILYKLGYPPYRVWKEHSKKELINLFSKVSKVERIIGYGKPEVYLTAFARKQFLMS